MQAREPFQYRQTGREAASGGVVVVRRNTALVATVAAGLLTVWAALLTWYAFGHDDFVGRFLAREVELRSDYEARVSALRARIDRITSQKAVEQDSLAKRILEVAERQRLIESRQAGLSALAGPADSAKAGLGASDPVRPSPEESIEDALTAFAPSRPARPAPAPENLGLRVRGPDRTSALSDAERAGFGGGWTALSLADRLAAVERSLQGVAGAQAAAADRLLAASRIQASKLRGAIAVVGLDPDRMSDVPARGGVGGPLVPLPSPHQPGAGSFEAELEALRTSLAELERLRQINAALPFGRPVPRDAEVTSGFGYRIDPFTRSPALHTGLDLRAEPGSAVRATGAGRVVSAESAGGYGFMVEIDHGHGVLTRYAHLSSFEVSPGQFVKAGTIIGRAGSTGRSTGFHLHYETRIDGEPVDPRRFLEASARLDGLMAAR